MGGRGVEEKRANGPCGRGLGGWTLAPLLAFSPCFLNKRRSNALAMTTRAPFEQSEMKIESA